LVGVTGGVHTSLSIDASNRVRIPSRYPVLREACRQTGVTHDDEYRLQQYDLPGNIRER
jgi:hypothetical protein